MNIADITRYGVVLRYSCNESFQWYPGTAVPVGTNGAFEKQNQSRIRTNRIPYGTTVIMHKSIWSYPARVPRRKMS